MCTNTSFLWGCGHKTDRTHHIDAKTLTQCPEAQEKGKYYVCDQILENEVGGNRTKKCRNCRNSKSKTYIQHATVDRQNETLQVVQAGLRSAELRFRGKVVDIDSGVANDVLDVVPKEEQEVERKEMIMDGDDAISELQNCPTTPN